MPGTFSAASARLADWRFLLPAPRGGAFEHLLLLGGPPQLDLTVRELGVAHRVSTTCRPSDTADAVVVLADATEPIEAAVRALGPDGVLYWEIDRRTRGQLGLTPARARRRLEAVGVNAVTPYWVKPGFPQRQMYLPLATRGAFRWYLDTLYRTSSRSRQVLKAALRALATDRRGLATVAPCYALTGLRGIFRPPAVLASAGNAGGLQPDQIQPVLLAHGAAEWSRVALLLFEPEASAPTVAIKLPRRVTFNQQVEWEYSCLRELRSQLAPTLRTSIPSSSLFYWNNLAVSVETCVEGATLSSRVTRTRGQVLEDLGLVVRWLADFHAATSVARVPAAPWLTERLVGRLCGDYAATFGVTAAERQLFATLAARLAATDRSMLPIVWQHTDFGPWNVYRKGDRISVIDWEVARRGPALADLLYFVTHWSAAVQRRTSSDERLALFEALYCEPPDTPLIRAIHSQLADYMRRVHMSPSLLPYLLVYTVVEQALDRARRFTALEYPDSSARQGNRYVEYLSVLAQHADDLMPREVRHVA